MSSCEHCLVKDVGEIVSAGWNHTAKSATRHVWWLKTEAFVLGVTVDHDCATSTMGPLMTWRCRRLDDATNSESSGKATCVVTGLYLAFECSKQLQVNRAREYMRQQAARRNPVRPLAEILASTPAYKSKF